MAIDKENQIKRKLLEKVNSSGKVYLLKNIDSIAKDCNTTKKDVVKTVQKAYLTSCCDFKFDLTKTRNNIKILALDKVNYDSNTINYITGSYNTSYSPIATYILSQFSPRVELSDIKNIYEFYIDINNSIDNKSDILYFAINNSDDSIYTKTRFEVSEVDYILNLIKKHGYSYEKDNVLYWKAYSPEIIITEEDLVNSFTIMSSVETNKTNNTEEKEIQEEKPKQEVKSIALDSRTALNYIANELGVDMTGDDSRERLEEMVATTNELIMNFSNLPDWEKLKSWEKFVQDWQAIMGDAINDRN